MIELVLRGWGVAVLPLYMVRALLEDGRLVRLLPDVPLLGDSFRLLFHADTPLAGVFEELAELLRGRPLT